jgi:hypothetical protein
MARKDSWWQNALEFALDPKNILTAAGAATGNPVVAGAGRTIGGMMDAPNFGPEEDARRSSFRSPEGEGFGVGNVMGMAGDFGSGYGMQQIGAGIKGHFQGTPTPPVPGVVTDTTPGFSQATANYPANHMLQDQGYGGEFVSQATPTPTPDPIGFSMNTPGVQDHLATTMPTDYANRFKPQTTLETLKQQSAMRQVGDQGDGGGGIKNWLKNMEPMEAYMLAEALSGIMQGGGDLLESGRRDRDRADNSRFIGQFMSGQYSPTRYPGRG